MGNVDYYNNHAEEFYRETVGLSMYDRYRPFLERLPGGGSILDAGCGSGVTAAYFWTLAIASPRLTLHRRWPV